MRPSLMRSKTDSADDKVVKMSVTLCECVFGSSDCETALALDGMCVPELTHRCFVDLYISLVGCSMAGTVLNLAARRALYAWKGESCDSVAVYSTQVDSFPADASDL